MSFPRYSVYKDSGVAWLGAVPGHWDVCALKYLASMRSGDAITADDIEPEGTYPVFGGNGLRGFTETYTHDGRFVLVGRQGALCGNINYADGRFWASEHAVVCSPRRALNEKWLGELLRAMNLGQYSVSAAQPGLSVEAIARLQAPVPPLPEQHAIAAFLDRETAHIDAMVAEQERLIELLREKRQAVISHAVTKGLDPSVPMKDSGVEWLGMVPGHWEVRRILDLARLESGHTPSRQHDEYWVDAECSIPWFTLADVSFLRDLRNTTISTTSQKISPLGMANSAARLLPAGTVILSRTASVGFSGITTVDLAVSQDFAAWICGGELRPRFLLLSLRGMTQEFSRLMFGATHQTIYMPDIRAFRIALPSLAEQDGIVAATDGETARIDALVAEAEHAITLLQERRSALISAAVTGQIDVRAAVTQEAS